MQMTRDLGGFEGDKLLGSLALGVLLWGIGLAWFFRGWLLENGDGMWGDKGDASILIAWLEHWHSWFTGAEADWRSIQLGNPERKV